MQLKCDGHDSNGVISILICGVRGRIHNYEYKVDAALIPGWRERILYHPHQHGAILQEIKHNATWFKRVD